MEQNSPFGRKLAAIASLSASDLRAASELYQHRRDFPPGRELAQRGQIDQPAYILATGWVASYTILPNGRRRILSCQIPGDLVGLRSVLFGTATHIVEPITPVEAREVLPTVLLEAFAKAPRLATAVLMATSRDEAMFVEHLVGLRRRNPGERIAHFLLDLFARLRLVGLSDSSGYDCPLSLALLGDALGLSLAHVNHSLRELGKDGLVTFRSGRVAFDDFDTLVRYANFSPARLVQNGPLLH